MKQKRIAFSAYRPRKRKSKLFKLENGLGSLFAHVVNGILISQPITSLDGIVSVPSPVILAHVSQRRINASLSGDSVGTSWEKLSNASRLETGFREAHSGAEACTSSANDAGIVLVIN